MQFVILPLIYKNIEKKQDCIRRCIELGKKIKFPEVQAFLLSGLLVFTDKVIRKDDSEEIRRYLGMTKIGKIIQEEIQQAVDESVAWTKRETRKKTSLDIAKRMLETGVSTERILFCVKGISKKELKELKKQLG